MYDVCYIHTRLCLSTSLSVRALINTLLKMLTAPLIRSSNGLLAKWRCVGSRHRHLRPCWGNSPISTCVVKIITTVVLFLASWRTASICMPCTLSRNSREQRFEQSVNARGSLAWDWVIRPQPRRKGGGARAHPWWRRRKTPSKASSTRRFLGLLDSLNSRAEDIAPITITDIR